MAECWTKENVEVYYWLTYNITQRKNVFEEIPGPFGQDSPTETVGIRPHQSIHTFNGMLMAEIMHQLGCIKPCR